MCLYCSITFVLKPICLRETNCPKRCKFYLRIRPELFTDKKIYVYVGMYVYI